MGRLFGTDGIRGIANADLTAELAQSVGRAVSTVLSDGGHRRLSVLLGCDTRASSNMLCASVAAGLCSVGSDAVFMGVVPTPAIAYLVKKYRADAGIMITASHNSAEYNGIKIIRGDGFKLPDPLEDRIESIVLDRVLTPTFPTGAGVGDVNFSFNAVDDYVEHLRQTSEGDLSGLSFAIDCANGAASRTAKRLFESLGVRCHMLSDVPDGSNINRACGSVHMERLSEYVAANKLDGGFAFDGDADRCLFCDENGNLLSGDVIMAILALDLRERGLLQNFTVVGTVMTNLGFMKFCRDHGLFFSSTKVGDRFVLEEMLLKGYSFGGEQSGHIIIRNYATTGDGQLTAVQMLGAMKRAGKPLSELATVMTVFPQAYINIPVSPEGKLSFYTDPDISAAVSASESRLGASGRVLVRPSGTEALIRVMVDAEDEARAHAEANAIAAVIREKLPSK